MFIRGRQVQGSSAIVPESLHMPTSSQITRRRVMLTQFESFMEQNTVSFLVGLLQPWTAGDLFEVCVGV